MTAPTRHTEYRILHHKARPKVQVLIQNILLDFIFIFYVVTSINYLSGIYYFSRPKKGGRTNLKGNSKILCCVMITVMSCGYR